MSEVDYGDLDFGSEEDCQIQERSAHIGGKHYILREADGAAAIAYRNASIKGAKIDTDGKVMGLPSDIAGSESLLVAKCLWSTQVVDDAVLPVGLVSESTIRSWPSRIQRKLFDTVKEMSDLGEEIEATDKAKNGQDDTMDGS